MRRLRPFLAVLASILAPLAWMAPAVAQHSDVGSYGNPARNIFVGTELDILPGGVIVLPDGTMLKGIDLTCIQNGIIKCPYGGGGAPGPAGPAPTLATGNTRTGAPGSSASLTVRQTGTAAYAIDATIPQGQPGTPGTNGTNGTDGTTPTFATGNTTTGSAGSSASVTVRQTGMAAYAIDATVPQGQPGTPGTNGTTPTFATGNTTTGSAGSSASVAVRQTGTAAYAIDATVPQGQPGTPGTNGTTPTFATGNTTTGSAGSSASVTVRQTGTAAYAIDATVPQGQPGTPGTNGTNGTNGTTPTFASGNTTTGAAGSSASVTVRQTGTAAYAIDATVPQGPAPTTAQIQAAFVGVDFGTAAASSASPEGASTPPSGASTLQMALGTLVGNRIDIRAMPAWVAPDPTGATAVDESPAWNQMLATAAAYWNAYGICAEMFIPSVDTAGQFGAGAFGYGLLLNSAVNEFAANTPECMGGISRVSSRIYTGPGFSGRIYGPHYDNAHLPWDKLWQLGASGPNGNTIHGGAYVHDLSIINYSLSTGGTHPPIDLYWGNAYTDIWNISVRYHPGGCVRVGWTNNTSTDAGRWLESHASNIDCVDDGAPTASADFAGWNEPTTPGGFHLLSMPGSVAGSNTVWIENVSTLQSRGECNVIEGMGNANLGGAAEGVHAHFFRNEHCYSGANVRIGTFDTSNCASAGSCVASVTKIDIEDDMAITPAGNGADLWVHCRPNETFASMPSAISISAFQGSPGNIGAGPNIIWCARDSWLQVAQSTFAAPNYDIIFEPGPGPSSATNSVISGTNVDNWVIGEADAEFNGTTATSGGTTTLTISGSPLVSAGGPVVGDGIVLANLPVGETIASGAGDGVHYTITPALPTFTASISGTTMTVTAICSGCTLQPGMAVSGAAAGTIILNAPASNTTGTYTVSVSQTLASTTLGADITTAALMYTVQSTTPDPQYNVFGHKKYGQLEAGSLNLGGTVITGFDSSLAVAAKQLGLPKIQNNYVMVNLSGAFGQPTGASVTSLLDAVFGTTPGGVLGRGATGWGEITSTQACQLLTSSSGSVYSAFDTVGGVLSTTCTGGTLAFSLGSTAVTAGSYGSASTVPALTVGADGRLTAVANDTISILSNQVVGPTSAPFLATDSSGHPAAGSCGSGITCSSASLAVSSTVPLTSTGTLSLTPNSATTGATFTSTSSGGTWVRDTTSGYTRTCVYGGYITFTISSLGSASGNFLIQGLPYSATAVGRMDFTGTTTAFPWPGTSSTSAWVDIASGVSQATVKGFKGGAAPSALQITGLSPSTAYTFGFNGCYLSN